MNKVKQDSRGRFVKGSHWRDNKPWWDRLWLEDQYVSRKKSAKEIADEHGVHRNAILYWIKKHGIQARTTSEARGVKHWGAVGSANPMWGRIGEANPNWKGGISPDRQAFYESNEWKKVCAIVWKRDKAQCQLCGVLKKYQPDLQFDIHHIVSFANEKLRAEPTNLVLLCIDCHHFVHSRENHEQIYLPEK